MKIVILSTIMVFIIQFWGLSQSCLPDGIVFSTQAQVDSFQTNYPGCTEIEGNVLIQGDDIENLYGLFMLTSIGGNFSILENPVIPNLTGLDNITSIGGDVFIKPNENLRTLNGLNNLQTIGGDLIIRGSYWNTNSINSIDALINLTTIGGKLEVHSCDSLTSLSGLDNIDPESITDLNIYHNALLSTCEIQSVCNYLSSPNGVIAINYNAIGCNNPPEIADACGIVLSCLPHGNYFFQNQDDIDNFQSNYQNCNTLYGNTTIRGDNITNLNGLNNISYIESGLNIGSYYSGNDSLIDLSGLNNLNRIGGYLEIHANDNLVNLTGLNNLDSIGGKLQIMDNDKLSSLIGLENLKYIGNSIDIYGTQYLENLSELSSINYIGNNIRISFNSGLKDCSGLENIDTVHGDLDIYNNDSLISLNGLQNLKYITENFFLSHYYGSTIFTEANLNEIGGSITIQDNNNLINLAGLENLTKINGGFNIKKNQSLNSIYELNNLNEIVGNLVIEENPILKSLYGLDNILPGSISNIFIRRNDSLSNCDALSICNYLSNPVGSINIYNNATGCSSPPEIADSCGFVLPCLPFGNYFLTLQEDIDNFQYDYPGCSDLGGELHIRYMDITNLVGLSQITSVESNLFINSCHNLTDLNGLDNLRTVGGSFDISANSQLQTTDGLSGLQFIGGTFEIHNNVDLYELTGCNQLSFIGEDLELNYNPNLNIISGFSQLDSIGREFYFRENNWVRNFSCFQNLSRVGSDFVLIGNNRLNSLIDLASLTSIGGDLYIWGNDSLMSLVGLDNIEHNSIENLSISYNDVLNDCDVESICAYLVDPGGDIEINNNRVGCSNTYQVLLACSVGDQEIESTSSIIFYPNPANNNLFISSNNGEIITQIAIFNHLGQKVLQKSCNKNNIDVSYFPKGLYIIEIKSTKTMTRKKLIIN